MWKRSRVRIHAGWSWHFFTMICCKNCIVCLKRPKISEKTISLSFLCNVISFFSLSIRLYTLYVTSTRGPSAFFVFLSDILGKWHNFGHTMKHFRLLRTPLQFRLGVCLVCKCSTFQCLYLLMKSITIMCILFFTIFCMSAWFKKLGPNSPYFCWFSYFSLCNIKFDYKWIKRR